MRKTKHTSGPWALFVCDGEFSVMPAGRPGDIATGIKSEADANLLRAAPDLLEAAKVILAHLHLRMDSAGQAGAPVPVFNGIAR
jgi:hypothetical protein